MFRRIAFLVHLYVGLSLGIVAALLGLSGALLVFRPELEPFTDPAVLRVTPAATTVPLGPLLEKVRRAYPDETVTTLSLPKAPGRSLEFWTRREGFKIYADPHTGRILGHRQDERTPFGFLFSLHTHLLAGERGEQAAGVAGIGLLLLSLSGLVVWWPRKNQRLRDAITIKRGTSAKRFNYDLHRAAGFYACAFLTVISLTGISLVWDDPAQKAVERVTGQTLPARPKASGAPGGLPLDDLVATADRAMPGGRLSRIALPGKAGDPLSIRKQFPHETHPNGLSTVFLDPATGSVLRVQPDLGAPIGQRIMNLRYPLHIGHWAGWFSRILQVLLGLTPTLLFVTGLIMWRNRTRKR